MRSSYYTKIAKSIKSVLGINSMSLFKKNLKKKVGKVIYRKSYSSKDIVAIMQELGMKKGSVVCIHSSMKEFYNFKGTAEELINEILSVIGEEGTLVMPAYPIGNNNPNYIFDIEKDKTAAGYLAETFRKYKGVKRSLNVQHSVCAIGKMADYLIKDHLNCHDCWDKNSPYYRMCELDALVFNLGMPREFFGTFSHCVESVLQYEHPYWAQFFKTQKVYKYYDENKNIQQYTAYTSTLERRMRSKNITKYFTDEHYRIKKISNLEIKVFYSRAALDKMIELGRKGISRFYVPSPAKYTF